MLLCQSSVFMGADNHCSTIDVMPTPFYCRGIAARWQIPKSPCVSNGMSTIASICNNRANCSSMRSLGSCTGRHLALAEAGTTRARALIGLSLLRAIGRDGRTPWNPRTSLTCLYGVSSRLSSLDHAHNAEGTAKCVETCL